MTRKREPTFQRSDVLRMFPTFVWKADLKPQVSEPINQTIMSQLGESGAPLATLAHGESWQSDHGLHELRAFRSLVDCVDEAVEEVLGYLQVSPADFEITGCWANASAPGAGHLAHSHPNNFLSGVYYVRTHEGADTINFHDPRPQTGVIRPPVRELTGENADQVVVQLKDSTLLLFPAWLRHSVDANRSGQVRISIGFNIMFTAYARTMGRPLWTPGRRPPR